MSVWNIDPRMQALGFSIYLGSNYPLLGRDDDYADFPIHDYLVFSESTGVIRDDGWHPLPPEADVIGCMTAFDAHPLRFPARPLIVMETALHTWQGAFGKSIELVVARGTVHSYGVPPALQRAKHKGRVTVARFALSGSLGDCRGVPDGIGGSVRGHWWLEAARPLFDGELID